MRHYQQKVKIMYTMETAFNRWQKSKRILDRAFNIALDNAQTRIGQKDYIDLITDAISGHCHACNAIQRRFIRDTPFVSRSV